MKTTRIVGLAALMALALAALGGVGTAAAAKTSLCKTSTNSPYCINGENYLSGTALQAVTPKKLKIQSRQNNFPVVTMECNSSIEAKTTADSGDPLSISVSEWKLYNCGACSASFKELPSSGTLGWTEGANGKLSLRAGGSQPQININCIGFKCTVALPDPSFTGGKPAQIAYAETKLSIISGSQCGDEVLLYPGSFNVTSPEPVYVGQTVLNEAHTHLCKVQGEWCSAENNYPFHTVIEAEAPKIEVSWPSTWGSIVCGKTTVSAQTESWGADPMPLAPLSVKAEKCSATGFYNCSMTASNPIPGQGGALSYLGREGNEESIGSIGLYVTLNLSCEAPVKMTCAIELGGGWRQAPFYGGNPATFTYTEYPISLGGNTCTGPGRLSATFTVTSPKPLFLT